METKFEIVETADYILAVSDKIEDGINPKVLHFDNKVDKNNIYKSSEMFTENTIYLHISGIDDDFTIVRKIIAYNPKHKDAPELDLPLLPGIVVKDDVEKLACNIYNLHYEEYLHIREHVSQTRECVEAEYEHLGLEIPNKYFDILSFIAGYNYKAATKIYSEEEVFEVISKLVHWMLLNKDSSISVKDKLNEFLQQPKTPKWFVAEKIQKSNNGSIPVGQNWKYELKTITIKEKTYLIGKYANQ